MQGSKVSGWEQGREANRLLSKIVHLGTEYDGTSMHRAEELLAEGFYVSVIGQGGSMEPLIHDGYRMVIQPCTGPPTKGEAYLCRVVRRGTVYHSLHLCWTVKRRKFAMITTQGWFLGWIKHKHIIGRYVGHWRGPLSTGEYVPKAFGRTNDLP